MSRAVSSLTRSDAATATAQQERFGLHGGVDGQGQGQDQEALGVELLQVAVLQGRVQQVGGGQAGGDRTTLAVRRRASR